MRFTLSSFLAIAVAAGSVVARSSERALSMNPPEEFLKHSDSSAVPVSAAEPATNAKRLAQGLPPMRPRNGTPAPRHDTAYPGKGTRIPSAPRSRTSPRPPKKKKCNILVKEAVNGTVFGFVSPFWNRFGEFGPVQPGQEGSLEVSFSYSPDSFSRLNLYALTTNSSAAKYPFMGASVGFISGNDFSAGSFNWAFLTGTTEKPYGPPTELRLNSFGEATSIPVSDESALWTYNPKTDTLTPQWVNTDGSTPTNYFLYANDFNNAFLITGDANAFRSTFGSPFPLITFTCVPPKHTRYL